MQSERQPSSWQIHLQAKAKAKHFDLKLQVATSNLYRFRIHLNLKLCPSNLLRYKKSSDSHLPNTPGKRRSMKSKFLRILRNKFKNKFTASHQTSHPQAHFPGNQPTRDAYQELMYISSIVIGFIALLFQPISQKHQKGAILYSVIILLYLAFIFKKFIRRTTRNGLLVVLMLAMLIWVYPSKLVKMSEGNFSGSVWKVCSFLGQVIPSSFSQWACRGDNFLGYWNF
ncbi:uncharacterized protein LOC130763067 isoform X1 [Actinidia eriantha]|uniref:uncharacterized protein LOC130763067 isoform X1 n=1 Tax=Actinidia eriantha TaxID=165200 RepID=UPI0025878A8C|nr:uncharacterized protein LOC130763067 isoform X1 [Actinidia eriantha]